MCDLRFAESAVFATSFSQRGLVAEHGLSWMLPRLVGPAKALDLLEPAGWTREAERLGLVDRVVQAEELLAMTRGYIEDLAAHASPTSIMVMKQQVYLHLMKASARGDGGHEPADGGEPEAGRRPRGVASFVEAGLSFSAGLARRTAASRGTRGTKGTRGTPYIDSHRPDSAEA